MYSGLYSLKGDGIFNALTRFQVVLFLLFSSFTGVGYKNMNIGNN